MFFVKKELNISMIGEAYFPLGEMIENSLAHSSFRGILNNRLCFNSTRIVVEESNPIPLLFKIAYFIASFVLNSKIF